MTFQTRKPTCEASFPTILLAGIPGGGKSWAAVEATAWEKVDRAYFLELGEGMADEYGAVPGADFEIIEHDGTLGAIRESIRGASEQPVADGKFPMLIIDSMTEIWGLITDNAQQAANARAKRKGGKGGGEVSISMDLWNRASEAWDGIMRQVANFPGPVVLTARLDMVTVMDDQGKPTKHKEWKIQAQKKLPYQATAVIEARMPRQWTMTKIATTVPELQLQPGEYMPFKDFSVVRLMELMGVGAGMASTARHETQPDESLGDDAVAAREAREVEARQQAAQQQAKQVRAEDLSKWADSIWELEKAGELDKIESGLAWAERNNDPQKAEMARGVVARMKANSPGEGGVHEAELVPSE